MLKFIQDLMDWWHGVNPTIAHDFVEPPVVNKELAIVKGARPLLEESQVVKMVDAVNHGMHRGRAFSAADNSRDAALMQPPNLRRIIEELKALGIPFLLVAVERDVYQGAAHGWCNGSNYGRIILEDIARCAELNFKQELAKCSGMGDTGRAMPVLGQGQYRLP